MQSVLQIAIPRRAREGRVWTERINGFNEVINSSHMGTNVLINRRGS